MCYELYHKKAPHLDKRAGERYISINRELFREKIRSLDRGQERKKQLGK